MNGNGCDLDHELIDYAQGRRATLSMCTNMELGMMRALSVAQYLDAQSELLDFRVVPLSGGQLIARNHVIKSNSASISYAEDRRVEVILTNL